MVHQTDKIIPSEPDNNEKVVNSSWAGAIPVKQGLYDPELEKDACGVGFAWYIPFLVILQLTDPVTSKANLAIKL
jgi:hypothetical protein